MILAYPWLLLMAPAILLVALFGSRAGAEPLAISSDGLAAGLPRSWRLRLRFPVMMLLGLTSLCCFSIGAARPQRITSIPGTEDARNLIISLDLSRSMETPDFNLDGLRATRLDGVKSVVEDLLKQT